MQSPFNEADEVAALLQGALLATCHLTSQGETNIPIKIREVEQTVDPHGNYRDHFTVVTESGLRIQVRVRPE